MTIIECPECGKEISSHTENCPRCGYPINKKTPVHHHSDAPEREYNARTIASFVADIIMSIIGTVFIVVGFVKGGAALPAFVIIGSLMVIMSIIGVLTCIYRWHQTH